jgi:hypothetical protein
MAYSDWIMDKAYYDAHGYWPEDAPKVEPEPEPKDLPRPLDNA